MIWEGTGRRGGDLRVWRHDRLRCRDDWVQLQKKRIDGVNHMTLGAITGAFHKHVTGTQAEDIYNITWCCFASLHTLSNT